MKLNTYALIVIRDVIHLFSFGKVSKEVNDKYPVKMWYQLLANEAFIRNQLYYYDVILTGQEESG